MSHTEPNFKSKFWIVVFDNGEFCVPFGNDPDCAGALCSDPKAPAVFNSNAAARRAIQISKLFAKIQALRGEPVNTDFTEHLRYVFVVPLKPYLERKPK